MKEYLQRGWKLREEILKKEQRLEFWRSLATSTSGAGLGSGGNTQSKIELATVQVVDLEKEITEDLDKLAKIEIETLKYIKELDLEENDKLILEMRYVGYKTWRQIAPVLNYTVEYLRNKHGLILKMLHGVTSCEVKLLENSKGMCYTVKCQKRNK